MFDLPSFFRKYVFQPSRDTITYFITKTAPGKLLEFRTINALEKDGLFIHWMLLSCKDLGFHIPCRDSGEHCISLQQQHRQS